jgi:hypothetical protein
MTIQHHCPACHRTVSKTIRGYIAGHFDTTHANVCPASFEPFTICIADQPTRKT